jgi:hypothetical protein
MVLVLIAIFVVLFIKLARKRHGHTQPVEGRCHNQNTTYREPSLYECPARQPQGHEYAELEREHTHDSNTSQQNQDLVHLYEEADKYFRGMNDNSGYHLTGPEGVNGKRPQFQCIM